LTETSTDRNTMITHSNTAVIEVHLRQTRMKEGIQSNLHYSY